MKVLYILNSLTMTNGISSLVMSYYKKFNHEKIKCDFIIHYNPQRTIYYDEIEKNGDNIYIFDTLNFKSIFKNIKKIRDFLKEHHDYDIIHCHLPHISYFYLKQAKKYGIPMRIIHVHNPVLSDKTIANLRNKILLKKAIKYSTDLFACSYDSGNKVYKKRNFFVQKNAFDYKKFLFKQESRTILRSKYNVTNEIVVGCVGRFTKQKNFIYVLKCLCKYLKLYNKDIRLFIVGNGKEKDKYIKFIKKHNLTKFVLFFEPTSDINEMYSCFDVLLMPSLFEGLGIVSLEAQVNGLHVIHSEKVPNETNIGGAIVVNLNNMKLWCESIFKNTRNDFIVSSEYSIEENVEALLNKYEGVSKW